MNDLRGLRERRCARPVDVVRVSGVSRQQLWSYERGRHVPSVSTIVRLAEAYGVSPVSVFRAVLATRRAA